MHGTDLSRFLGHFQPEAGRPALWELDSDHHYRIGSLNPSFSEEISRSMLRRSLSDGDLICEKSSPITPSDVRGAIHSDSPLPDTTESSNDDLPVFNQEITSCEGDMSTCSENEGSYSRHTPSLLARRLFTDMQEANCTIGECSYFSEQGGEFNSDILDLDWLSSSGNSCEDEAFDRSSLVSSPAASLYGHGMNEATPEVSFLTLLARAHSSQHAAEYSGCFARWVEHGATFVP
ncbi:hypothetical protein V2J09_004643 [Rumex salicifolius]